MSMTGNCTCGNNYSNGLGGCSGGPLDIVQKFDASFVHLPPSLVSHDHSSAGCGVGPTPASFIESHRHLVLLERVALADETNSDQALCLDCAERIRTALELDSDRLEREREMYEETTKSEYRRQENLVRAIQSVWPSDDAEGQDNCIKTEWVLQNYSREIEAMKETCRIQTDETAELLRLQNMQKIISQELDDVEWNVEEHQNFLELEARSFDNAEEQAWKQLSESAAELEQLASTRIQLPAMLIDLKVDKERGLRYPLINELRLAYRPKGDVDKIEIQLAWSLAAQLLLACGSLLQYQSQHWKIVPLSTGAKLIGKAAKSSSNDKDFIVYNLGHPKANRPETLLAWNDLMHGVVQHAICVLNEARKNELVEVSSLGEPPFTSSNAEIGGINLLQLDANDDSGWSRAIHCISSNLLWLSDCASRIVLSDVLLAAKV
ncbi:hypothetical protein ACA910_010767 [Epithemia clementina (nom. ined.)]